MTQKLAALTFVALMTATTASTAGATGPVDDLAVNLTTDAFLRDGVLMASARVETLMGFELRGQLTYLLDGQVVAEAPLTTDSMAVVEAWMSGMDRAAEVCVLLEGELRLHGDVGRSVFESDCADYRPEPALPLSVNGPSRDFDRHVQRLLPTRTELLRPELRRIR